jgi:hypothetical protein
MWPMRFRIKTIMVLVALVGVSLGIAISLDRELGARNPTIFGSFLINFWTLTFLLWSRVLAWRRRQPMDTEIGNHKGGDAEKV